MGESFGTVLESAAKALFYAATLASIGVCAARWRLAPALPPSVSSRHLPGLLSRLARVGAAAGGLAVAASLVRVWAHTATAFGLDEALSWENVRVIAVDSRWGSGWRLQVIAASLVTVAFRWARRYPTRGWVAATATVGIAACSVPLLGHAAGDVARSIVHVAHVLGAGVWLGALVAVVVSTRARRDSDPFLRAALLHELAAVALPGSALLGVSGVWASWWYVGSFEGLASTTYGRTLVVKLLLVGGVLACGFVNWRRYRNVPHTPFGAMHIRDARVPPATVVFVELVFAALVVAATSVLTELEHPTN